MADLGALAELALGRGSAAKPATVDTGGAFVIRELTGQMRAITLNDRARPYRPYKLTGAQRVDVTWLPGYAVATATVLGATEKPTSISGKWKEVFIGSIPGQGQSTGLGLIVSSLQSVSSSLSGGFGDSGGSAAAPISVDGKPVLSVQEAVDLLDDVRRQGQLLEVTWGATLRHGHLTEFTQEWDNTRDCAWDMEFEWTSRGDPVASAVHALDVTAQDTRELLEQALDDVLAIMAELPAITNELTDLVTSQLQKISTLVASVGSAVQTSVDAVLLPVDTTRRILGTLESIEGECVSTVESVESKPAIAWNAAAQSATRVGGTEVYSSALAAGDETGFGGPARLTPVQRVQTAEFTARLKLGIREIKNRALERRVQLARQIRSELAGTFIARDGDDLRDVAFQFYGESREWRRIMLFNGLASGALTTGQIVRVPRIAPAGESGDLP
jgi:hypothetical protein